MQIQSIRLSDTLNADINSLDSATVLEQFKTEGKILLKNKVLLSPGVWNGLDFSQEEIAKAFTTTDWTDKYNYALIYDHDEKAINWLGNVLNIRLEGDTLMGDLEILDEDLARKLTVGGAKLGISARVLGKEDEEGKFVNFTFNNFSVVYDPACKNAYINLSQDKVLEEIQKLREELIKLEAGVTGSAASGGSPIGGATTNQPIKYPKKKKKVANEEDEEDEEDEDEDLKVLKGGKILVKKKMSEETQKPIEEQTEEVVEAEVVKPIEAPVIEAEAVKAEPVKEEEEDKEELSSALSAILSELKLLSAKVAKLEEVKAEVKEEVAEVKEATEEKELMEKVSLSIPEFEETEAPRHALLGNTYSESEMRLAKVLQDNARE